MHTKIFRVILVALFFSLSSKCNPVRFSVFEIPSTLHGKFVSMLNEESTPWWLKYQVVHVPSLSDNDPNKFIDFFFVYPSDDYREKYEDYANILELKFKSTDAYKKAMEIILEKCHLIREE